MVNSKHSWPGWGPYLRAAGEVMVDPGRVQELTWRPTDLPHPLTPYSGLGWSLAVVQRLLYCDLLLLT